jgi:hypothetical protein
MFERGANPKKTLGIGISFENLQRGMILLIKKDFSTTKYGEINNHTNAYNKFFEGRYIVIKSTPTYNDLGSISFKFKDSYSLNGAQKIRNYILSTEEERWHSRIKIEGMSRLQFERRFEVVS